MYSIRATSVILLLYVLHHRVNSQRPESPCPNVFMYENKNPERDRWYGVISVKSSSDLRGIWLRLKFDRPVLQVGNWLAPPQASSDYTEYLISDRNVNLRADTPRRVRFYAQYSTNQPPPRLTGIKLNGENYCFDEGSPKPQPSLQNRSERAGPLSNNPMLIAARSGGSFPINLVSPCPRLFVYEPTSSEPDRWYGLVTLLSETDLTGVWLRLNFDKPIIQLGNWFGQVREKEENTEFVVYDRNFKLKAGVPKSVRIYVQFDPNQPPPQLKEFRLNAITQCPEGAEVEATTTLLELQTSNVLNLNANPVSSSGSVQDGGNMLAAGGSGGNRFEVDAPGQSSPCPRLFVYDAANTKPGRWSGLVTLLSDTDLKGVWLRLMFNKPVLNVETAFGKAEERDGKMNYLIMNPNFKLQDGVPQTVNFYVQYNTNDPAPQLIGFKLNARDQCPEGVDSTTPTLELQTSNNLKPTAKPVLLAPTTKSPPPSSGGGNTNSGPQQYEVSTQGRVSPCPRLFVYETSSPEPDRWYGLVTLLSETDLKGVWLRLMFDKPVLNVGTFFGKADERDNKMSYLINDRDFKLQAGVPQPVRFSVQYNTNEAAPRLTGFKLNARTHCPEGADVETTTAVLQTSDQKGDVTLPAPSGNGVQLYPVTLESPCPRLFVYETTSPEPNRWYGIVTLLSDTDLTGVWLRLNFDKPIVQLGNWFGQVRVREENTEFVVNDRNFKLKAGVPQTVRIYVQFKANESPPQLKEFRLNAIIQCPEGAEVEATTSLLELQTSNVLDANSSSPSDNGGVGNVIPGVDFGNNLYQVNISGRVSPCPRLFVYETSSPEPDRWYGLVTLLSETDLRGVWLRLMFDKPVLGVGSMFGKGVERGDKKMDWLISNRNFKLRAGVPQSIRFYIQFDTNESPPQLTGFRLNARNQCPEGVDSTTPTLELQTSNDLVPTPKPAPSEITTRSPPVASSVGSGNGGVPQYEVASQGRVSPCPRLFVYEASSLEPDRWYGLVTLLSETDLKGVWLKLMFDKPVPNVGSSFGKAEERDNKINYVIMDRNFKLQAGVPQTVRFYVQYNTNEPAPQLIGFKLNARNQCPEGSDMDATTPTLELQTSNQLPPAGNPMTGTGGGNLGTVNSNRPPTRPGTSIQQANTVSPCPRLFMYESSSPEPDRWYGIVTVLSETDLKGVWLRLMFDKPVVNVVTFFGQAQEREMKKEYLISDRSFTLKAGTPQTVRFSVQYTNQPPPRLTGFKLNGTPRCPEGLNSAATTMSPELQTSHDIGITASPLPGGGAIENPVGGGQHYPVVAESPCPRLFVYEPTSPEPDRWYGIITLLSEGDLTGIWLRINFDRPVLQVGNWFGSVRVRNENTEFVINDRQKTLKAGVPQTVRFYVRYDTSRPAPQLTGFKLNARTHCPEGAGDATMNPMDLQTSNILEPVTSNPRPMGGGSEGTKRPVDRPGGNQGSFPIGQTGGNDDDVFPGDHAYFNQSQQAFGDVNQVCGTMAQPKQNKYGQSVNEGKYPWHSAVYHTKGINLVYWCGAALISKNHVVTVAHCVTKWRTNTARDPENFVIYLGKFYLNRFTRGVQERLVDQIIPHPQYSPQKLCNDIALIRFIQPVEFTDYVRPICLWQDTTDLNMIVNEQGSVAGWGVDGYGKLTEQLTHTQVTVGSLETCTYTLPTFYPLFIDNTTYCSGFRSSAPICNGDSGNAMIFPRRNQKDNGIRWHLRGLLSLSIDSSNRFRCDTSHYIVFTDVAKYLGWIKQIMRV